MKFIREYRWYRAQRLGFYPRYTRKEAFVWALISLWKVRIRD